MSRTATLWCHQTPSVTCSRCAVHVIIDRTQTLHLQAKHYAYRCDPAAQLGGLVKGACVILAMSKLHKSLNSPAVSVPLLPWPWPRRTPHHCSALPAPTLPCRPAPPPASCRPRCIAHGKAQCGSSESYQCLECSAAAIKCAFDPTCTRLRLNVREQVMLVTRTRVMVDTSYMSMAVAPVSCSATFMPRYGTPVSMRTEASASASGGSGAAAAAAAVTTGMPMLLNVPPGGACTRSWPCWRVSACGGSGESAAVWAARWNRCALVQASALLQSASAAVLHKAQLCTVLVRGKLRAV
jgi:hypothetical protein